MSESARPLIEPPRPGPGARVALVAPAGPLRGRADLERAVANARAVGWEPVTGEGALARDGYFAGSDRARMRDLQSALESPQIDGIWCLRGGYGAARLLSSLPIETIARNPKALIGYSDITALHSAWALAGLVSFHGPTARATIPGFSLASFRRTIVEGGDGAGTMSDAVVLRAGVATGRLAGGNLALVASLCGTPWAFDFRGCIVVLEDINEATYRLDRMLLQLRLAGAFDGCAALLLGQFTSCPPEADDGARTLESVMQEHADLLGVPAVLGAPFGHVDEQWTLPLGAMATLDTGTMRLAVHRDP